MKRTPLRKVSKKQSEKNHTWSKVKAQKLEDIVEQYGFYRCEWSGEWGLVGGDELYTLDAHHIDGDRSNNTYENCFIVKRKYHSIITDNNIDVEKYPTLRDWTKQEYWE